MEKEGVRAARLVHIYTVLLALREAGGELPTTELIEKSGIVAATYYGTVRKALLELELIEEVVEKRARIRLVRITDKGRKLLECLENTVGDKIRP
jgi:DNA-binding MarR family transcriptional regulator